MAMAYRRRDFLLGVAAAAAAALTGGGAVSGDLGRAPDGGGGRGEGRKRRAAAEAVDAFFDSGPLPTLHLELDPTELRRLEEEPKAYVRAHVRETAAGAAEGVYCDVGVHLKGGFGSVRPVADKPALTLNFDKFVAGQSFHGLDKVHLNNAVQDASYLRENLAAWVFRESGVPAPRVSAARVWLNGRDAGVYVLKEGFDGPFYDRFFKGGGGGDLYDGNFADVDRGMAVHLGGPRAAAVDGPDVDPTDVEAARRRAAELSERHEKAAARLQALADACREVDPGRRNAALERVLDVERFVSFLACETLVAHWDGYGTYRNNFRVYHDPRADRLVFLPHGMDQVFQRPEHSLYGNNAVVALAVTVDNPSGRRRYLERVAEIRRRGAFRTDRVTAELARLAARVEPLFAELGPEAVAAHAARTAALRRQVVERGEAVDRQLANPPRPVEFDAAGVAVLGGWKPVRLDDGGDAACDRFEEGGAARLRVTCGAAGGGTASWRTSELLTPGTYTFSARMRTEGVVPRQAVADALGGGGACLRVSGSRRTARYAGDTDWRVVAYTFAVTQPIREVTFICELSAGAGRAVFDPATTTLRRHGAAGGG